MLTLPSRSKARSMNGFNLTQQGSVPSDAPRRSEPVGIRGRGRAVPARSVRVGDPVSARHTPGPWEANLESDHGDYIVWGPEPLNEFIANLGINLPPERADLSDEKVI